MEKNQNAFNIIFDGDVATLNSEVLIATLLNTTNILQEINKDLRGPTLKIYIKPFAPGSFMIQYAILAAVALLDPAATETVKYLIGIIGDILKLKKLLGGKKPAEIIQEGEKLRIKNNYGDIVYIDNRSFNQYKNNEIVNDSLNKMVREIDDNENISAFKMTDGQNRNLFEAQRSHFKAMSARNELLLENTREKMETHVKLVLYRIWFAQDRKWAFVYQDIIISAYIVDEDFFKHFRDYRFGSGDYIEADLKIIQKYDETAGVYINIDYEVIKVHSLKERSEQKLLGFPKDKKEKPN